MEEIVAGDPIDAHATGKADGLLLVVGHLAVVDVDVTQHVALAVTHGAIGVDVTDALTIGTVDVELLDGAQRLAAVVTHAAVGLKRAHRAARLVAHHAVAVDAADAGEVGVAQHLSTSARCHNASQCQHCDHHV